MYMYMLYMCTTPTHDENAAGITCDTEFSGRITILGTCKNDDALSSSNHPAAVMLLREPRRASEPAGCSPQRRRSEKVAGVGILVRLLPHLLAPLLGAPTQLGKHLVALL